MKDKEDNRRSCSSIFEAAANDDVIALREALAEGQSLDEVHHWTGLTPVIVAILERSENFLGEALLTDFDPWIRDPNERLAIDHANALGLRSVQKQLHEKMYPRRQTSLDNVVHLDPK